MNLFEKPPGVETRWASFENRAAGRNCAGSENRGGKGHPSDRLVAGETMDLLDAAGSGIIRRIWMNLDSPAGILAPLAPALVRMAGLADTGDAQARADTAE